MIIPILRGLTRFGQSPVTWILFALNLVVFIVTSASGDVSDGITEALEDSYFANTQGQLYAQFISAHPKNYNRLFRGLSEKTLNYDEDAKALLGSLALKDALFVARAPSGTFAGDQVAVDWWRLRLGQLEAKQLANPVYSLGLTIADLSLPKYLTYMFAHTGLTHFVGNMFFLIVFGCALEPIIGGLLLLLTFLGAGVAGACTYLMFTGASLSPLVGASAAICGWMAMFCVLFWQTRVRYFYWLLVPGRNSLGVINLPASLVLLFWGLADGAGYLSAVDGLSGVAYTAHLGGEFTGVVCALGLLLVAKEKIKLRAEKFKLGPSGGPIAQLPSYSTPRSSARSHNTFLASASPINRPLPSKTSN